MMDLSILLIHVGLNVWVKFYAVKENVTCLTIPEKILNYAYIVFSTNSAFQL